MTRNDFAEKADRTEQEIADAFAIASNRFWCIEDDLYDFDEGTPEYIEIQSAMLEWHALMQKHEQRILDILASEGVDIPEKGRINVLSIFMKRNGYADSGGWWVRKNVER